MTTFFTDYPVLIVDDDAAQVLIVKSLLERAGYRTLTAPSGLAALEMVHGLAEPLLLLLTDVDMPGMTGRALADAIRSQQPRLPVLYLTAHADALFGQATMLGPGEAFLEKPVTPGALGEAVRMLIRPRGDAA